MRAKKVESERQIRNEREMGRAVEKEKRMCQNAHFGFTLIVSLILYISRVSCSKNKKFSPLMSINCLINCPINRRVKETKRRRDKKKTGQRQKPRKPLEEYGGCAAAVMLPFWSYKSKLLTPNRQHPPCLLSEGCHSLQGDKQK